MITLTITLGDIDLKDISSLHSNSSGYDVINKNFQKIKQNLDYISLLPVVNLNNLIFPTNPVINTDYILNFNGSKYVLTPIKFVNNGIKWRIRTDEVVNVGADYQYMVHNRIDLEGTMDLEGELVIL